ncbi:hypothetical protein Athai_39360 [Actinocatenispora thailandica]|uniref:DUF58 domain-containing protein n=1 Tax=Actinocatenispora thailandica TaxID=227318 RepID=A0A7R7DRD0_9ACTN|nr:DUF58 domain-containing protein [Actinocatenispora thailandica]BCJ36433.1 hypothetical protein Athai_39360 [Actinocatenispora thailandica]
MTAPTGQPTMLPPRRDGRLVPYLAVAIGALVVAVVAGAPAVVALAVPFLLALGFGLARTGPLPVTAGITVDTEQLLEGDLLRGEITLDWSGPLDLEVLIRTPNGMAAVPGHPTRWAMPAAAGPVRLPVVLRAAHWGRHPVGEVWVRARAPRGLLVWQGRVATGPSLRVLPQVERLNRLLDPAESRTAAGVHQARRIGEGYEFAELRPYEPGDRLRDLNWGATARHRRPYVNRHHPELSGEVVVVLDTYTDGTTEVLARAARAAWAIASVHLQAGDRVGLIGLGGGWRTLHPAGGERAKYQLLETMLAMGADAVDTTSHNWVSHRLPVPESALVIALTSLYQRSVVRFCQEWRSKGRTVAVAVLDAGDALPPPTSSTEVVARRLWRLEIDRRRAALTGVGIPVVTVGPGGLARSVVGGLRRAGRRSLRAAR